MSGKNILVIGATSAIAQAVIRQYAEQNHHLFLVGRQESSLQSIADDAKIRGAASALIYAIDLNDVGKQAAMMHYLNEHFNPIDIVLIAHGTLPNQHACQQNVDALLHEVQTNAISTIALLTPLANKLEQQGHGTLAVITSVAGDRGRQSNYVYGSAKSMVSTFLQGLRNRLASHNVNVLDIKPGFVDTPMTADFKKGPLWAKPEQVASSIIKAIAKQKHTLYTPFFWWGIMLIIRNIPEAIFKRLSL